MLEPAFLLCEAEKSVCPLTSHDKDNERMTLAVFSSNLIPGGEKYHSGTQRAPSTEELAGMKKVAP